MLFLSSACRFDDDGPIDRSQADEIAGDWYREFVRDQPAQAEMLGALTVQEHDDGWSYRWPCKNGVDSSLGVYVERSGQADYDQAPICDRLPSRDRPA